MKKTPRPLNYLLIQEAGIQVLSLFKDTLFYSMANWGRRLVGFITVPVIIVYFTPEDYGYMSLVNTLASFCSILGLLAVADQGLPRFFIDSKDTLEKQSYVSTSFFISGLGVFFVTFLILCSTPIIPLFIKGLRLPLLFTALIALICITRSFHYVGSNMLKWTFQSPLFTKITLTQALTGSVLTIGGIIFLGWQAKGVLFVGALVALGAGAWANISARDYVRFSSISKKKIKALASYSWPLLGLNIFAFFTRSLDRIFLASLTSLKAVGIFSVSYTIASIFETLVSGFFFAWGPYVLSTFREKSAPQGYARYFSLFSCLGIMSIIVLGLWGSPVVLILKPDGEYKEIGVFIPWIVSGTLLYYLGGYFAPGPAIKKKTYWKLIAFVLAASSNALLNYTLIPRLGILGAGIATTASSLLAGIFNQVISNRLFFVPNRWKFSFAMILLFTSIVSLSQHERFVYNINEFSFIWRVTVSVVMIILGSLPFYKDIKATGLLNKFAAKIF